MPEFDLRIRLLQAINLENVLFALHLYDNGIHFYHTQITCDYPPQIPKHFGKVTQGFGN